MIELLLEPFSYDYMTRAIWVSALVGGLCAFLSCFLMLKGWSLMGDALAHAIVPGVALSYLLALPYAVGAFFSGMLAAFSMAIVKQKTNLREDAVIGLIFTAFFAIGLLLISINPVAVDVQNIILGNVLAISDFDVAQVIIIAALTMIVLILFWKDFMALFFDEDHAQSLGLPIVTLKVLFFTILSAMCVAALQTVGAVLVIAMLITPGAAAYLLTDRFGRLIIIACALGACTSAVGAYASYFLNAHPGAIIVTMQTLIFLLCFMSAPKYGIFFKSKAQGEI